MCALHQLRTLPHVPGRDLLVPSGPHRLRRRREDAAQAGFDDQLIYDELPLPYNDRRIRTEQGLRDEAQVVFAAWNAKADKLRY